MLFISVFENRRNDIPNKMKPISKMYGKDFIEDEMKWESIKPTAMVLKISE